MTLKGIKKTAFWLVLVLSGFCLKAQNPGYSQLVSIISSKLPGANVNNKVIAFVSWSANNAGSRDMNREFNRVGSIYQGAKLKNGSRGMYVISCNMDDPATATIVSNKDGIDFSIRVTSSEFNFLSGVTAGNNVVYDNTGAKVSENIALSQIFMSFNQLVTR